MIDNNLELYENLVLKYPSSVFEFCINNNNKGFGFIPIDGKIIKIEDQYVLRTSSLRQNKEEYDDFSIGFEKELNKEHELMLKNPQHLYCNLLMKKDIYDVLLIYSKKSDKEAVKELDELTYIEYLKFAEITSEDEFIRSVRKSMSIFKKEHPNNDMTLEKILKGW